LKLIPEEEFLEWASRQEIGVDDRYSDPTHRVRFETR
jgi:hypothetical protein